MSEPRPTWTISSPRPKIVDFLAMLEVIIFFWPYSDGHHGEVNFCTVPGLAAELHSWLKVIYEQADGEGFS